MNTSNIEYWHNRCNSNEDLSNILADSLIITNREPYFYVKDFIIKKYGYNTFRDIQRNSFIVLFKGKF